MERILDKRNGVTRLFEVFGERLEKILPHMTLLMEFMRAIGISYLLPFLWKIIKEKKLAYVCANVLAWASFEF